MEKPIKRYCSGCGAYEKLFDGYCGRCSCALREEQERLEHEEWQAEQERRESEEREEEDRLKWEERECERNPHLYD